MKLRIQGDSLRLRLSRSEVARLRQNAHVEDAIDFGSKKLIYILVAESDAQCISAIYDDERIRVVAPRAAVEQFADTDQVSLEAEQRLASGASLQILVEKDFKCIHKPESEDSDAYPNPLASQAAE
jgi:hypothetical protein